METKIVLLLVIIIQAYQVHHTTVADIQCMYCTGATSVDECKHTTATCGANEECFLEKVTTPQLTAVYNAGCRSKTVCNIMASLAGSGKRSVKTESYRGKKDAPAQLISCADCCNAAPNQYGPCNSQVCGQQPTKSDSLCRVCDGPRVEINACTSRQPCAATQACYTGIRVVGTAVRYVFGCEEKHVCAELIKNERPNHPGRAIGLQICDACCVTDDCNADDCFLLKKNMTLQSIGVTP